MVVGFGGFCMLALMVVVLRRLLREKGSRKLVWLQDIAVQSIMSGPWYCSAAMGAVDRPLWVAGWEG